MDVRALAVEDAPAVRSVARRSLAASYEPALEEETIAEAVGRWYDDDAVAELTDGDAEFALVAVDGGSVVGFVQAEVVDDVGQLRWLHVDPDARRGGVGDRLLAAAREELAERGVERCTGHVLAANEDGQRFYRTHGFEKRGERTLSVGGVERTEYVYAEPAAGDRMETATAADGERLYVDYADASRGTRAPFAPAYRDEERTQRYGWVCANCGSADTTMDTMGRVECADCGNSRRPSRWDAGYL